MKKIVLTLIPSLLFILLAYASGEAKKVAQIKTVKGEVLVILPGGKEEKALLNAWVSEGSVIKTAEKSFARLSFVDKSTVNIGPNSQMQIEKFSSDEAGVLNVISGKIRSQVSKDYLQMEKDKSKLFVKSKSAVMGIRGTDFAFSYNPKIDATTAVLFKGSVVFNKLTADNQKMKLEEIVNRGHSIRPGQFSVSRKEFNRPTVPAKMSTRQFVALEKNQNFDHGDKRLESKTTNRKSVVPAGLSGDVVSSSGEGLKEGLKNVANLQVKDQEKIADKKELEASKGFVKGDYIKPVDGSIVHIDSGTIIPLGGDSVFDQNQIEWVSTTVGGVDQVGNYQPPEGYIITEEGKLLKKTEGGQLKEVVLEVKPLDQAKSIDQLQTIDYIPVQNGPAPAGQLDQGANNLAVPPLPPGTTYMPPSYHTTNPNNVNMGPNSPITPVKINVNSSTNP
jgi:hypothetical protein